MEIVDASFNFIIFSSVFRIVAQNNKTDYPEDEDDQVEKVDEEQLVSCHFDPCILFLLVAYLGLRTRCCYWEDT